MHEATGLIASLSSAVEREVYGGRAAQAAGISMEAMAQEVKKELKRRLSRERKRQERHDLAPAANMQPDQRGLHYDNVRSAAAEEGVLRLALLEPGLLDRTDQLTGAEFSSPLLGKVFDLLRDRHADGRAVSLGGLANTLTPEEMSHLARVVDRPESLGHAQRAMKDYIAIIRMERMKQAGGTDEELLRAAQKYRQAKSYGGE